MTGRTSSVTANGKAKINRRAISLEKKRAIIEEVEMKVRSQAEICRLFDVPPGSVYTIMKNKNKIMDALCDKQFNEANKKMRGADYSRVDRELYIWYKDMKTQSMDISGAVLLNKAKNIATGFGIHEFVASKGWLWRWKCRHGIVKRKEVESFPSPVQMSGIKQIIVEGSPGPGDIFNVNEFLSNSNHQQSPISQSDCERVKKKVLCELIGSLLMCKNVDERVMSSLDVS